MSNFIKTNGEGYDDPTPYEAIKNIQTESKTRFYKLLHTIFHVCEIAGFEVKGRIEMVDKKTGNTYK